MTKIGFSLNKISVEQFALIEDGFNETGNLRIGANLRFGVDEHIKVIACFSSFIFESNRKPFIVIEAGCHFEVEKDAWTDMFDNDSNSLKLPRGFLSHLAVLTVGTTRGVLFAKTEGTTFNKYVLPTINVTEMIKEDLVFNFNSN